MAYMINTTNITTNYSKKFFKATSKDKIHLAIHALLYMSLAFSSSRESTLLTTGITVTIIIYFLFSKPDEHFFFLVGFVPFEYTAKIGGVNAYFIFLLISSIKLVISNINKRNRIEGIISLFFLVSIEIIREFVFISKGELLIVLSIVVYFCFFILFSDKSFYNTIRIVQNYCLSYIVVIIQVINMYGSLRIFFQVATTDTKIIRFGQEATSIGGAMGIPLYSALVISILLSYYIIRPNLNAKIKLLILTMSIVAVVFGTLTISRSFLLTMLAWLVLLVLSLTDKQRKKVLKILLLIIAISAIIYYVYEDLINGVISDFLYRIRMDSGTGIRGMIWESCYDYLNGHPLGYLFGYGIRNYVEIGFKNNLMFGAMAHNLYIDIIMSIGIVGFICLVYLVNHLKSKVISEFHTKTRIVTATPLLVFLTFGITALSLNNFKTWIYIIMVIIFAYANPKENIEERRNN